MRVVLFLAPALIAISCASADETPTPTATAPAATDTPASVTLQFWTVLPYHGVTEQNLAELVRAFQREYPLITVKVSSQPTYTDLYRKVVAAVAAGTLPDLVTGLEADIAEYARLKALAPLDPYLDDPTHGLSRSDLEDLPAGLRETISIPGETNRTYSLPFARGALALYYNWGAMKAIQITNAPRTWDEFRLHARSLTKNPVRGFAYRSDVATFHAMLAGRGGSLFNAGHTKATFNAQAGIDTLAFLAEGVREGWIYRAEGASDLGDFASGKAIFTIASTAAIPVYRQAVAEAAKQGGSEFEWGVSLLPQADPRKPAAVLEGANIAMLKSTEARQRAAWQFMKWLLQVRTAAEWARAAGVLPARQSSQALLSDFFATWPQQKRAVEEVLPHARAEAAVRSAPEIHELIEAAMAAVESGRAAPKAALDEAAAKVTILLNEKK